MAVSGVNVRDINVGRARILGDDIMPPRRRRFLHFQTIMSITKCFLLKLNLTTAPQVVEGENNIFVPKNGEWVDATTERFIYQVFALTYLHSHPCSHPCSGAAERFLILHSEVQQSEGCSGESSLTFKVFVSFSDMYL